MTTLLFAVFLARRAGLRPADAARFARAALAPAAALLLSWLPPSTAMAREIAAVDPEAASAPTATPTATETETAGPDAPGGTPPPSPRFMHLPRSESSAGEDVVIDADVRAPFRLEDLTLHFRPAGGAYHSRLFERSSDGKFVAAIPAEAVRPPSVAYFVTAKTEAGEVRPVFATKEWPHEVVVHGDDEDDRALVELHRRGGRRSEVRSTAEYVDFDVTGRRGAADRYFWTETEYRYALLGGIDEIVIGAGVLRGEGPANDAATSATLGAFHYGYSELALRPATLFGLSGKLMLGANQDSFGVGAEGLAEIGRQGGTRLDVAVGHIAELGTWGRLGLHWDTVRGVMMGAGVELTSLPVDTDTGVRLLYDVSVPVASWCDLTGGVGYQARDADVGGPAASLGTTFRF